MSDSSQQKLSRNRPPRVQITYDVEIGNAIEKKEIPFVMGIMANLSGYGDGRAAGEGDQPEKLKERGFIEIDRDNFTAVMARINPRVSVKAADAQDPKPDGDTSKATVSYALNFKSLDDFSPENLVVQLQQDSSIGDKKSIQALYEERKWLRDMLTKLDGNDNLEKAWADATKDDATLTGFLSSTNALLPPPAADAAPAPDSNTNPPAPTS